MAREGANATTLRGNVLARPSPVHVRGTEFRAASYNIGWNENDKSKGIVELQQEVQSMVSHHEIHVLLLCEVFEIEGHHNAKYDVVGQLIKFRNQQKGTSSAGQPAVGTWAGASCNHYVAIWRTDCGFECVAHKSFDCRVPTRIWQQGQYLRFKNEDWPQLVHIINCHCPSSPKRGTLKNGMRKIIAKTARDLVCGEDNAAQPVALFCGDYNNTLFQWNTVINESL